jgi:DNA replication and repair protein RecF
MGFYSVACLHFRNLKDGEVALGAPEIFLVGENGQGKTNFLESLYLLCYGASFRTPVDARLIRHGQEQATVRGRFGDEDGLQREVAVRLERLGHKEIRSDGKPIRDRALLIENIPCILFSHQDLETVTGAPEMRRRFFNQVQSLFDPLFIGLLRSYRRALRTRNLFLREGNRALLSAGGRSRVELGLRIQERRTAIVEEFNLTLVPLFRRVSGLEEEVRIQYRPSWRQGAGPAEVLEHLEGCLERDLVLASTSSGPHRDRFVLLQGEREFAHLASTGQVRLGSLLLRVAQARFFLSKTGRRPVLLLDDVLLELDSMRRERFLAEIPAYEQAFFTFLPDEQFLGLRRTETLIYRVEKGGLARER